MIPHIGQSDYHGLQTSFTKRMSQRWQGSLTYTLAGLWDQDPPPLSGFTAGHLPGGAGPRRRTVAGGNRSAASRRCSTASGRWGTGFQVSGIYFYGSGQRTQAVCGCDARGLQITSIDRLRLDGTIIPREAFVGDPIHRVELRLQQRVPLGGSVALERVRRSIQPVQPRELRQLQRHRNQPDLRAADLELEPLVRAAHRAARVQAHVLILES